MRGRNHNIIAFRVRHWFFSSITACVMWIVVYNQHYTQNQTQQYTHPRFINHILFLVFKRLLFLRNVLQSIRTKINVKDPSPTNQLFDILLYIYICIVLVLFHPPSTIHHAPSLSLSLSFIHSLVRSFQFYPMLSKP